MSSGYWRYWHFPQTSEEPSSRKHLLPLSNQTWMVDCIKQTLMPKLTSTNFHAKGMHLKVILYFAFLPMALIFSALPIHFY